MLGSLLFCLSPRLAQHLLRILDQLLTLLILLVQLRNDLLDFLAFLLEGVEFLLKLVRLERLELVFQLLDVTVVLGDAVLDKGKLLGLGLQLGDVRVHESQR